MGNVKAISDRYHAITPFHCVKGANEFIEFCKKAFGAEERMRMPGPNNAVMHAELQIGDSVVMVTDAIQDAPTTSATHYYVQDCDAAFSGAIGAGAKQIQPPADMPWGDRFARLEDKWGNRWSLSTHIEDVSMQEVQKRMAATQKP